MSTANYLSIKIAGRGIDVEQIDGLPITISYALEEIEDFEKKKGSEALGITVPATTANSQIFNTPHRPESEDLTDGEVFKGPLPVTITAAGTELLHGKAFITEATHTDRPESIKIDCYGSNADWVIDLKESTLWDFVNPYPHEFSGSVMENSWAYDGRSEGDDFVYAPVRGRQPFGQDGAETDRIVTFEHLQPSVSIYWILYRAFKSLGYQIKSEFLDTDFFRRQVMPWTWGGFLFANQEVIAPYKFRAMCNGAETKSGMTGSWNEWVSPTGSAPVNTRLKWSDVSSGGALGGFINTPGTYGFHNGCEMCYTYPAGSALGPIKAAFELGVYYYVYGAGSPSWGLRAYWFVIPSGQTPPANPNPADAVAVDLVQQYEGGGAEQGVRTLFQEIELAPGQSVYVVFRIDASSGGSSSLNWTVGQSHPASSTSNYAASYFQLSYFKKTAGSPINLREYTAFKKYKLLDLLRGVIDDYDLLINTVPETKTVVLEPAYPYQLPGESTVRPGYFKADRIDWNEKQDFSQLSTVVHYRDNAREFIFKHKDDSNDGGLKLLEKRASADPASATYLFPDRFKSGKEEHQNRFFSAVSHVRMPGWASITGVVPQLVALLPENVSNTSSSEDARSFEPKLCYYKGQVIGSGGFKWQKSAGAAIETRADLPFLFAVNYGPGGENDPVLSYSDELINGTHTKGLLRRFFLARLAVMRHGKLYKTWMRLNLTDVTNWLHREAVMIRGSLYYLVQIDKFKPLVDGPTAVTLWHYSRPVQADDDAVFPSRQSLQGSALTGVADRQYFQLLLLSSDLPTT